MIFQIISIIVMILLMALFIRQAKNNKWKAGHLFQNALWNIKSIFTEVGKLPKERTLLFKYWRKLFYLCANLLFIVLVLTGFIPAILFGSHLSGTLLIIHVIVAPLFVLSLMLFIIFRAHSQQFNQDDFQFFQNLISKKQQGRDESVGFLNKLYFWLFAIISLPAILSMILSMYPLFGTEGQILLLNIHRLSVLLLSVLFVLHQLNSARIQTGIPAAVQTKK